MALGLFSGIAPTSFIMYRFLQENQNLADPLSMTKKESSNLIPDTDLRETLLRIGKAMLNEVDEASLNMREVARRSGCTHQAPYYHFRNKEGFVAALVASGFEELAAAMGAAHDQVDCRSVGEVLKASAISYLEFAIYNPGLFRTMFAPVDARSEQFLNTTNQRRASFAEVQRLGTIVFGPRATPVDVSLLWVAVHGLSNLVIDGKLVADPGDKKAKRFVEKVIDGFVEMFLARAEKA
ncbi:TetR/AcrR family transcriptional regulator [Herbaspirillum sp. DW155]|uniref:TetR/AcrR family transcriptional regulator n=1 Tax=Herbaspirillum sp. DW155 TaxID=3095609 RepID=UPI0030CF6A89